MALPWFKKQGEELPTELQGLEPADLVNAVNKARDVDQLRTELTAANERLSEVDTVKAQLAQLEQRLRPPENSGGNNNGGNKPTSFLVDEERAFAERIAPLAVATFENQAQSAKFMARSSLKNPIDAKIWDKYEAEIDQVMQGIALQFRAQPQVWINALDTVAGRHRHEISKMQSEKTDFFAETASGGGNGGPGGGQEQDEDLSPQETNIALKMGLKPEDYKKYKKEATIRA
jgi:hypothetical protein